MIPSTTHLTSQNFDFFIDGGYFVLSQSRDYPYISHSNKYRSYYLLYQIQYNYFSVSSDSGGSVVTITINFSHKVDFGRDRYYGVFRTYHNHCTESPVALSFSKDSSVVAAVGSSFDVSTGYGKGIVGPRPTQLTSQKLYN